MRTTPVTTAPRASSPGPAPRRRRGVGLLEGLIALVILAFGMLALTRMQAKLVAQATDAQSRQTASELAAELITTVLVDPGNAACYTRPQSGSCANTAAVSRTAAWSGRVAAALPGTVTSSATLVAATGRLTVAISWTGKDAGDPRSVQLVTDVRQ